MMRAVKDNNELMRLAAAKEAADSAYGEIVEKGFAGRLETEVAADLADLLREFGHEQVDFTVVGSVTGDHPAKPCAISLHAFGLMPRARDELSEFVAIRWAAIPVSSLLKSVPPRPSGRRTCMASSPALSTRS